MRLSDTYQDSTVVGDQSLNEPPASAVLTHEQRKGLSHDILLSHTALLRFYQNFPLFRPSSIPQHYTLRYTFLDNDLAFYTTVKEGNERKLPRISLNKSMFHLHLHPSSSSLPSPLFQWRKCAVLTAHNFFCLTSGSHPLLLSPRPSLFIFPFFIPYCHQFLHLCWAILFTYILSKHKKTKHLLLRLLPVSAQFLLSQKNFLKNVFRAYMCRFFIWVYCVVLMFELLFIPSPKWWTWYPTGSFSVLAPCSPSPYWSPQSSLFPSLHLWSQKNFNSHLC